MHEPTDILPAGQIGATDMVALAAEPAGLAALADQDRPSA